jgi:hypothetical protein
MKNTRLLKVVPQILLLSVFALSSCGNKPNNDQCLTRIREILTGYKNNLSEANWTPPQNIDTYQFKKLDDIGECKSLDQGLDNIKDSYKNIYQELNDYKVLVSSYDPNKELVKKLKLTDTDLTPDKQSIDKHTKFISYTSSRVSSLLSIIDNPSNSNAKVTLEDLDQQVKEIKKTSDNQTKRTNDIYKELESLKSVVYLNSLFNLLILTGVLGSLGYFFFSKINTNKPDSLADKKRKSRSGNLGAANPQSPNNQGSGNPAPSSGKGLSGGRGMGANRPTRNSPTNLDEDFDERQSGYHEPDSDVGYQQQQGLKSRLNKPAQNREYTDPRDIEQQDFSDRSSSNINPPSPRDNYGQTYLPQARVNRVQLTENLAIQSYQSKSYSSLEASTVGYYSATPESVTRNRADWANPLDLVEFFDGLFWIIKASERNLLFPNPRMRIEQTRIRGIEYFFETNYSDENYHSCTVDAPAYVELVNGKWVRIKKGRVTFAY